MRILQRLALKVKETDGVSSSMIQTSLSGVCDSRGRLKLRLGTNRYAIRHIKVYFIKIHP